MRPFRAVRDFNLVKTTSTPIRSLSHDRQSRSRQEGVEGTIYEPSIIQCLQIQYESLRPTTPVRSDAAILPLLHQKKFCCVASSARTFCNSTF